MGRPAPIRTAGILAATALCAAAATEASAQDGSLVLNNQLQLGDVIAGQTLHVEGATDQVTVTTSAQGNSVSGSVESGSIVLRSTQDMRGDVHATTSALSSPQSPFTGDTEGVVNAATQAGGNYLAGGAYGANLAVEATQVIDPGEITAGSEIRGGVARLLAGGAVSTSAFGNTTALGGTGTELTGTVDQSSAASVRSSNLAETQYIPASAMFSAQAANNAVAANSTAASHQQLAVRQRSTGGAVTADVSANAGNAQDLTGRAQVNANQAVLANQGGSMLVSTDQGNVSTVRSSALVTSYDYGAATAYAQGAANAVSAGNNDRYLELDNSQINSGGVEVQAAFSGTNGYDAYVSAEAAGNTVTGYACAQCDAQMGVTNTQTNSGNVTATANTGVYGSGRAVITGANAVGNAATFYVSRPDAAH